MNHIYHTAHKGLKTEGTWRVTGDYGRPCVPPQETMPRVYFSKPTCPNVPSSQAAAESPEHLSHGWAMTSQNTQP